MFMQINQSFVENFLITFILLNPHVHIYNNQKSPITLHRHHEYIIL